MELAMMDGWTSGKGLGMGLSGTKRLVNEFDIESSPGVGTTSDHHALEIAITRQALRATSEVPNASLPNIIAISDPSRVGEAHDRSAALARTPGSVNRTRESRHHRH